MQGERRPASASPPASPDEPILLQPPEKRSTRAAQPEGAQPPRSERNEGGYQETPEDAATAEANREASENCALLHRARRESDDACAPAEDSPGAPREREHDR